MSLKLNANKFFVHVDYGSRGNSGLYISKIINSLRKEVNFKAYVHKDYIYNDQNIVKIFDLLVFNIRPKFLQQILKLLSLSVCLFYISISLAMTLRKDKYLIIELYEPFSIYKYFIKFSNFLGIETILTVHDVEPLYNNYPKIIMCDIADIIWCSKKLIVHTDESCKKLEKYKKEIFNIPFPLMEIKQKDISDSKENEIKFLFIGHLRKEKGIEILLDAWRSNSKIYNQAYLTIAGSVPFGLQYDFTNLKNCTLISNYVDDETYSDLVNETHYVLLPYTAGTNSGILSTVASLGKPCITSDLEMFKESSFLIDDLVGKIKSSDDLEKILLSVIENHDLKYNYYKDYVIDSVNKYEKDFCNTLNDSYDSF